jgi:hypothetical protein
MPSLDTHKQFRNMHLEVHRDRGPNYPVRYWDSSVLQADAQKQLVAPLLPETISSPVQELGADQPELKTFLVYYNERESRRALAGSRSQSCGHARG